MSRIAYTLELTKPEAMALVQLLRQIGGEGEAREALSGILEALQNDAHVPVWRFIKWRHPNQRVEDEPYPSAALYAYGEIAP